MQSSFAGNGFGMVRAVFALIVLSGVSGSFARAQQPPPPAAPASSPDASPVSQQNPPARPGQAPPTIVSTTGLVHLVVTVMDRHHAFITDLDKSNFKVTENGEAQEIRFFGR